MTELTIVINLIGGLCPVQAEGTINGEPFYFRARGERWRIGIGGDDVVGKPAWTYAEPYGTARFEAGYMTDEEALAFIQQAAKRWAAETAKVSTP